MRIKKIRMGVKHKKNQPTYFFKFHLKINVNDTESMLQWDVGSTKGELKKTNNFQMGVKLQKMAIKHY